MARESNLWTGGLKHLMDPHRFPLIAPHVHLERVENALGQGGADVDGSVKGWGPVQFELKSVARPARASTPLRWKVQPQQVPWNAKRWSAGGNNWWLCQVGEGSDRVIYLMPGCFDLEESRLPESDFEHVAVSNGGGAWIGPRWQPGVLERTFITWEARRNAHLNNNRGIFG